MSIGQLIRTALSALVSAVAVVVAAEAQDGPRFRADGPNADLYGLRRGYPACAGAAYLDDSGCRVGTFSTYGDLYPSRAVRAAPQSSPLRRAAQEPVIRYPHDGTTRTLDDYLETRPVTGLLIARGDTILVERYQYGRNDRHAMTSFSMAKSIVGVLVGLAIERGAIRSIDDTAQRHVPELAGTQYGRTPIKALLQMASGVAFNESYGDRSSDIYLLSRLTLGQDPGGSVGAVKRFDTRRHPPGATFWYSSAESLVLGLVVARATGRTVSDLASDWLWQPLGAEADARWSIDATGQEITYAHYNAVLRDWGRLGLMLAHKGTWAGRSIVPETWLAAATERQAPPAPAYGYHFWLSGSDGGYSLRGRHGQFVMVDPASRTTLVQTAVDSSEHANRELTSLWLAVVAGAR